MTQAPVQAPGPAGPVQYVTAPSNGLATASLVLGIIGAALAFIPVIGIAGALLGGLGFLLGVFGFLGSRKHGAGKGKAIAGLVLGVASVVIFILISAATVAAVDSVSKEIDKSMKDQSDTSSSTDVSDAGERKDAKLGAVTKDEFGLNVKVTVTNSSKNESSYIGTVVFESPDGKTQYGTGTVLIDSLKPGQTKVEEVSMLEELPPNAKKISVRLTDFDRTDLF
jgi:hypothetical protein